MSHAPARAQLERAARLLPALREQQLDALLVTTAANVRYLTAFTGSHGLALVCVDADVKEGSRHRFFTDFRYQEQSAEQVPASFEREIVAGSVFEAVAATLERPCGRLGFDQSSVTVSDHARLRELLPEGWELVPSGGAVERLRAVKEPGEVERIRAAAELADRALREELEVGLVGRTEREVAFELELRMRRLGAESASFPAIVAAGPHAALPHAEPSGREIAKGELVTIDWGALHEGYCSDCTRTYATGAISTEAREIYELVRAAQEAGLAALRAGSSGRDADAAARTVVDDAGQGKHFGHGLGHGVGLEVHEAPRLSRTAGDDPLSDGNVVTVEPGVYLPGRLGVRIEDLAVVREGGQEVISTLSKELTVIS